MDRRRAGLQSGRRAMLTVKSGLPADAVIVQIFETWQRQADATACRKVGQIPAK
jgi:hypothetical protein